SRFVREWVLSPSPPHFFDQRMNCFQFGFTQSCAGPYAFARGFFAADVVREGDRLLDIGCGDGFFTRRFYAERCAAIDALDIEPTAIEAAELYNGSAKIAYRLCDAVADPFPRPPYDVIVWDGALGHFPPDVVQRMCEKIRDALNNGGVFVGSESL